MILNIIWQNGHEILHNPVGQHIGSWQLLVFGHDERLRALRQKAGGRRQKGFKILPVVIELVTKIQIQPEDFSCDVEIL